MEQRDLLECPFCGFVQRDTYFLMQHVELTHPENGESPFIVKDDVEPAPPASSSTKDQEGATEADRNKEFDATEHRRNLHEYVECPKACGERLLAAELPSHMDMHIAEDLALEDAGVARQQDLTRESITEAPTQPDVSSVFSTRLPKALRNYSQLEPKTPPKDSQRRRISLKDLFFESLSSPETKKKRGRKSDGAARRLGVWPLAKPAVEARANRPCRDPNWALMHTKDKCHRGCESCSKTERE